MPSPQIPTLLPDVIDAIVRLAKAWPGLGNGQDDSPPVYVYDGPTVQQVDPKDILWVGMDDPDSEAAPIGGEIEQNFASLGAMARDEEGNVHCVAESWSGSKDVATVRNAAFATVREVAKMLRADATLGGTLSPGWAQVSRFQLRQNNVDTGAVARVSFQVLYKGRI